MLLFLVLPLTAYSEKHIPYYKSLAHDESWLRHYPENQDLNKQTEKFLLTEENMPVKVIEEFRNSWSSYTCLLYTSPSPRDLSTSRMPSSA